MQLKSNTMLSLVIVFVLCGVLSAKTGETILRNDAYKITVQENGSLIIQADKAQPQIFEPRFTILISDSDPQPALRWGQFGEKKLENMYNIWTWGRDVIKKSDPNAHIEDGFNPQTDQTYGKGRTANYFHAAPYVTVTASKAVFSQNTIQWIFPEHPDFELAVKIELPAGSSEPQLNLIFTPKKTAWFSVGYTGAPQADIKKIDGMWQPMIWHEKRFPNDSYITASFQCPLPTTLVTKDGITIGVVADPAELGFQPMPTNANSLFGVLVRNADGKAQPMLFAPVLGGLNSFMQKTMPFAFRMKLLVHPGNCTETYEYIARHIYGFNDFRNNALCSLNTTLDNMIDYGLSKYSMFVDDLRGCSYATDVPGAVKNIGSLHPMAMAMVTDNEEIYTKRARPMMEYSMSREKFLFTTNPKIKGQSASSRIDGPGVPVSELTALYSISQNRSTIFLESAEKLFNSGKVRILNLDVEEAANRWQDAMALYRATGDKKYLDKACKGADTYLAARIKTPQTDFSDPESRGMFFWTSYAPQWMELYELYEQTHQQRYLDASLAGARDFTQFIWLCPLIPDTEVLVNETGFAPSYRTGKGLKPIKIATEWVPAWRVSEIGLTPESSGTCKGHRGILLTTHAPWMLRLAYYFKDNFLHDIARSAVIGRYTNFPGYHMNTARTTVYEKPEFPLCSLEELNSATSLHYNHPWTHIAMVLDYLVSDVFNRSEGRIDFPSQYAEGYAYVRNKVYGDRAGKFYDEKNVWLWMPKNLLKTDSIELNYIAARGDNKLCIAFTNQSNDCVTSTLSLNPELVGLKKGLAYNIRVMQQNKPAKSLKLIDGQTTVSVAPQGITALIIEGLDVKTKFQQKVLAKDINPWKKDNTTLDFGGAKAIIINMGPELTSAYIYLQATGDTFKEVTLKYTCGQQWKEMTDNAYPFEFTVPLTLADSKFEFKLEAVGTNGGKTLSEIAALSK